MKKVFYTLIAILTIQIGLAQASSEAKTYIKSSGIVEQIEAYKSQVIPIILEKNLEDFNKEFEKVVASYISDLENIMDENFEVEDLKKYNENFAANATATELNPKDIDTLQQKTIAAQEKFGQSLQEVVEKYGNHEILGQM